MSPITEDELRARLNTMGWAEADDRPDLVPTVVAKGRRRRTVRRVALGAVAVATVGAVAVLATQLDVPGRTTLPATPTPDGSSLVSPSPSDVHPSASASSSPSASTSGSSSTTPSVVGLPPLLHEGATVKALEAEHGTYQGETDYAVLPQGLEKSFDLCTAAGAAGLPGVIESRAVGQTYGSGSREEGILVFRDAGDALAATARIRAAAAQCSATAQLPEGGRQAVVTDLPGAWGEGFMVRSWSTQRPEGNDVLLVARVGRAIAWSTETGDGGMTEFQVSGTRLAELRAPLDHLAPLMCRYTEAGC